MRKHRLTPLSARGSPGNNEAADYFRQHNLKKLLEDLSMDLALNRPRSPLEYLKKKFDRICSDEPTEGSYTSSAADADADANGNAAADELTKERACYVRVHIDCAFNGTHRSTHFFRFDRQARATAMFLWETEAAQELKNVVKEVCGSGAYGLPSTAPASPISQPTDAFPPPPLNQEPSEVKTIVERLVDKWQVLGWEGCNFDDIFCKIDTDGDGEISLEELRALLAGLKIPTEAVDVEGVLKELDKNSDGLVNVSDVSEIVNERFERQVVTDLMRNLDVAEMLSRRLLESRKRDGHRSLESVIAMARNNPDALRALLFGLGAEIAPVLQRELEAQHDIFHSASVPDFKNNTKYAVITDNLREAGFGELSWFKAGLDGTIGLPDINILQAMEREHESTENFRSGNYGIETNPRLEWLFVRRPEVGKVYPGEKEGGGGRRRHAPEELVKEDVAKEAGLSLEEVIALRLYTGPMYRFYNGVLRQKLQKEKEMNTAGYRMDSFVTTIHMIASGVVKLSSWSTLPPNRKVYRGQQGVRLPECFFQEDRFGCRGGVELAFMSTTLKMSVALQYARKGAMPIIFEIDVGQVDRGASLSWLSQFPEEDEVLLPPLSNLEVIGIPQVRVVGKINVLVCSVRLNVNLRSPVKEELEGRRKLFHMGALHNNVQEIERDLRQKVQQLPKGGEGTVQGEGRNVMQQIVLECEELVAMHADRKPMWYNEDVAYKQALEEASNLRTMALQKFQYWAEHTEVADYNIDGLSLAQVYRLQTGQLFRNYRTAPEGEERRRAALDLAVWIGEIESDARKDASNGMDDDTAVIRAAAEGENQRLKVLIDAGCSVGSRDRRGFTALSSAACNGYGDCLELLIERGSDLEARTDQGETALFLACRYGHRSCVEILLNRGGDMLCQSKRKSSCLMAAAEYGHLHIVELLCHRDEADRLLHLQNDKGWTCLHVAARQGHVAIVKFLVHRGGTALVQKKDKSGRTSLHCAARSWRSAQPGAQTEVVQILEDTMELDVSDADAQGRNSLHLACLYGHHELVRKIIDMPQGGPLLQSRDKLGLSCLHLTARGGALSVAAELLASARAQSPIADAAAGLLEARAKDGRTCLHWAAANGKRKLVGLLVEKSLELLGPERSRDLVLAQRNDGRTAMHYAACNGHKKVVQFLLELPARLREDLRALLPAGLGRALLLGQDHEGWTCLHWATEGRKGEDESRAANVRLKREQKREVVAFLCEQGGPELYMAPENTQKLTCMHLACASGFMEMVEVLYDMGREPLLHQEDGKGRTCLHFAAANGRKKVVEFLYNVGGEALLTRRHKDGRTCMHFAAANGHKKVVDYLRQIPQLGRQLVMSRGEDLWTTLHWAASSRFEEVELAQEQAEDEKRGEGGGRGCGGLGRAASSEGGKMDKKAEKQSSKQASERIEVARLLCQDGGTELVVAQEGRWEQTSLHMASGGGSVDMVQVLLEAGGAALLWMQDKQGRTALHSASASGRWRVAERLVEEGGEKLLRQRQRDGRTSLMGACGNNHKKTAEWLLSRGGDELLLATDEQGWTCLHWAVQNRRGAQERSATWDVRVKQAANKKSALVRALCEKGGPDLLRATTNDAPFPLSCLHLACASGETEVVATVLEALEDAHERRRLLLQKGPRGFSCLHSSARTPIRPSLVRLLVEEGGQELAEQADEQGRVCTHLLCGEEVKGEFGEYEPGELETEERVADDAEIILAEQNEDADDIDGEGQEEENDNLSKHGGADEGEVDAERVEALEALLCKGWAGVLCADRNGFTPLHVAAKAGRKRLVQCLLTAGGDALAEMRDLKGRTAVELAMEEGREDVVEALMRTGSA